jgi:2-polyprenyl-3-methyl-5-hydroxy-6-metoxy-1,4-benzoquinol methylase
MKCCENHCDGLEQVFDTSNAESDLEDYRKQGAANTTRVLVDTIKASGVDGLTLIDIGGGVGAIQHLLLEAGVSSAVGVDASRAYIHAAKQEAERLGHTERITFKHGNFVTLAPEIDPADIVTLDRVICCYPDPEALVGLSSAHAKQFYGVVFPRDTWWMKIGGQVINLVYWIQRNPFRFFVHPTAEIDAITSANGLQRRFSRNMGMWQVIVYGR